MPRVSANDSPTVNGPNSEDTDDSNCGLEDMLHVDWDDVLPILRPAVATRSRYFILIDTVHNDYQSGFDIQFVSFFCSKLVAM
jgi:hypothetical protein